MTVAGAILPLLDVLDVQELHLQLLPYSPLHHVHTPPLESEAQVSMDPFVSGDVDAEETIVKIVSISKKDPDPDPKKHKYPQ